MVEINRPGFGQAPLDNDREIEIHEETAPVVVDHDVAIEADGASELPKRARHNADGSITLPLLFPVTVRIRKAGGEERTEVCGELKLARLTGADMRAIAATSRDSIGPVSLARSARMSEGRMMILYDRMDASDTSAAEKIVGFFIDSGKTTGR